MVNKDTHLDHSGHLSGIAMMEKQFGCTTWLEEKKENEKQPARHFQNQAL